MRRFSSFPPLSLTKRRRVRGQRLLLRILILLVAHWRVRVVPPVDEPIGVASLTSRALAQIPRGRVADVRLARKGRTSKARSQRRGCTRGSNDPIQRRTIEIVDEARSARERRTRSRSHLSQNSSSRARIASHVRSKKGRRAAWTDIW